MEATVGGIAGTFPLPMSLGSLSVTADANVSVTGQELTMQEGQADATDASAELTGIGMTVATGNTKNIIWNPVDTGTAATWTEVDTAA